MDSRWIHTILVNSPTVSQYDVTSSKFNRFTFWKDWIQLNNKTHSMQKFRIPNDCFSFSYSWSTLGNVFFAVFLTLKLIMTVSWDLAEQWKQGAHAQKAENEQINLVCRKGKYFKMNVLFYLVQVEDLTCCFAPCFYDDLCRNIPGEGFFFQRASSRKLAPGWRRKRTIKQRLALQEGALHRYGPIVFAM